VNIYQNELAVLKITYKTGLKYYTYN
jgi:hypothetical protein